jgi:integrase
MSAMSSAPVITRHLDYLRAAGLATTTITAREGVLRRLAAHLGDVPLLYATHDDLVAWQASRTRGAGNATRHAELCHARQFYRWAVAERLIAADPTARLALPRIPRRMPRPMRDVTLADAIGRAGPVDAAILGLAAFAGLRAIEIARLDWAEIDTDPERPTVHVACGKGGHARTVPLSPALAVLLARLPGARRGPVIPRADRAAGHNTANAISLRASRYLHSLGVAETLHQARHRFATATYQACRDIRAVQDLMGHASPSTTAAYAKPAAGVARDAVERAGTFAA